VAAEDVAQFVFGSLEDASSAFGKVLAGAIDVEVQHRHGGLIRLGLAAFAAFGGTLQRESYLTRAHRSKNFRLQVERVAALRHPRGPTAILFAAALGLR